jgi:hypothetical protein
MKQRDLQRFKTWFSGYCRSFTAAEGEDPQPYVMKEEHTWKVCDNIRQVIGSLALGEREAVIAETVALFHDVGRFPQYRHYGTFRDSVSVNHAALGAKVLVEQNVLAELPDEERMHITNAVTLHNVLTLPRGLDEETFLFTKLIRDADKLDIWRVFIEYYGLPESERSAVIGMALPETRGYTPGVLACLLRGEMVRHDMISTQNDFKLLQLSWVFDLNFPGSFRLVSERGYVARLASTLPDDEEVRRGVKTVEQYVERKKG